MSSPKSTYNNSLNLHRCRFTCLYQIQWILYLITYECSHLNGGKMEIGSLSVWILTSTFMMRPSGKLSPRRMDSEWRRQSAPSPEKKLGATFFQGTKPIDGVWHTPDVIVTGACVMPTGYSVGNHRLFVIGFLNSSLVGLSPPGIVRSQAWRLNMKIPCAAEKYVDKFENNINQHNTVQRPGAAHESSTVKSIVEERVDKIDEETRNYMTNAEKKCRQIKSGRIPFSPDSVVWICQCQVYRSILRYHADLIHNRGNFKQAARGCGIKDCLRLSLKVVRDRLKICKDKCKYFRRHWHRYRRKHLNNRLAAA